MRRSVVLIILALLASVLTVSDLCAELVSQEQVLRVATNWVTHITQQTGKWGDADAATISEVQEFRRGDRLLGYYCPVQPDGFVVVYLLKGLVAVKMFSGTGRLDIESDEGSADLLKIWMERTLDAVEAQLGPVESVRTEQLRPLLAIDHTSTWELLDVPPERFGGLPTAPAAAHNYKPRDTLIKAMWHQGDPFYRLCPANPGACADPHCTVGCVATSGSQIMRYWSWPPGRDWMNMPDSVFDTSTVAQIDAVSQLGYDRGNPGASIQIIEFADFANQTANQRRPMPDVDDGHIDGGKIDNDENERDEAALDCGIAHVVVNRHGGLDRIVTELHRTLHAA